MPAHSITVFSQVSCADVSSSDNWKEFLQNCDYLSSMSYRPIVSSAPFSIDKSSAENREFDDVVTLPDSEILSQKP
jgi:hypothetical protein